MVLIVMGVSGSGKTTIGKALAQRLGWPFWMLMIGIRSPTLNRQMRRGQPLTDKDREPWIHSPMGLFAVGLAIAVTLSLHVRPSDPPTDKCFDPASSMNHPHGSFTSREHMRKLIVVCGFERDTSCRKPSLIASSQH